MANSRAALQFDFATSLFHKIHQLSHIKSRTDIPQCAVKCIHRCQRLNQLTRPVMNLAGADSITVLDNDEHALIAQSKHPSKADTAFMSWPDRRPRPHWKSMWALLAESHAPSQTGSKTRHAQHAGTICLLDPALHDAALVQKDRFCHKSPALACNRQSIKAQRPS